MHAVHCSTWQDMFLGHEADRVTRLHCRKPGPRFDTVIVQVALSVPPACSSSPCYLLPHERIKMLLPRSPLAQPTCACAHALLCVGHVSMPCSGRGARWVHAGHLSRCSHSRPLPWIGLPQMQNDRTMSIYWFSIHHGKVYLSIPSTPFPYLISMCLRRSSLPFLVSPHSCRGGIPSRISKATRIRRACMAAAPW